MQRVLGIVGTGLIGASIGLAARAHGWRVIGYDRSAEAAEEAVACGAIDRTCDRATVYAESTAVAIAAYVDATLEELGTLSRELPQTPELLFDVASVKGPIARAGAALPQFVPTHPMAGSERGGASAACADLFAERTWAYIERDDAHALSLLREIIALCGARAVAIRDADEHDRIVAYTSHLPQLLASAFSARANDQRAVFGAELDALCGPAARELRRLGRSDFALWRDIFRHNASNVARDARALARTLDDLAAHLEAEELEALGETFARARR